MSPGPSEGANPDPLVAVREPERLRIVHETGLHDPEAPDSLYHLTSLALRTLECSTAFVSVVDEERVLVRSSRGEPSPLLEDGFVPVEESFCQNMVARGEPLVVRDATREDSPGSQLAVEHGLLSYLEAPIEIGDGTVIGGFCVAEPRARDWTDEDVGILETFAAGASSEIRLRREVHRLGRREKELEERAFRDPVTELPNRHLLWERVDHALVRSARTGADTAILFLDIDDFRRVNERHGHAVGDLVLSEIGHRIGEAVRDHETPARFGGDEFVVLLEDLDDAAEAEAVARRIADSLREPVEVEGRIVDLSVSIGLAVASGAGEPAESAESGPGGGEPDDPGPSGLASRGRRLLQAADWAMYRAKDAGGISISRY